MKTELYLIWSHEHRAWWRPAQSGYTENVAEAGRYSFDEAAELVMDVLPPGIEVAVSERHLGFGLYQPTGPRVRRT